MVDLEKLKRLDQSACGGLLAEREAARKEILFFTGDLIAELTALRAKASAGDELRKFVAAVADGSVWNAKDSAQFALANFDKAIEG